MPKDTTVKSSSFDRATISPYSKISNCNNHESSSCHIEDDEIEKWEEIQCPICMEHPHNAVLLHCSSRDKGCRPFICDTQYPHSNCLDQFRNLSSSSSRKPKILCPLCRGAVTAFDVVNPTRAFMDSKTRGCAVETCGFAGNYGELRKHAAAEHLSEAGPTQRSNRTELVRSWEIEYDLLDVWGYYENNQEIEYDLLDVWGYYENDSLIGEGFWDMDEASEDEEEDSSEASSSFFTSGAGLRYYIPG